MADGDNLPRDHQRADDCQPFALSQTAGDTIGSRQREHSRKGKTRARPGHDTGWAAQNQPLKRSEEHTSELQSLMRISYAVFCLKKKKTHQYNITTTISIRTPTSHIIIPQTKTHILLTTI